MESSLPKVLHQVGSKTIIQHVIGALYNAKINDILIVVGFMKEKIIQSLNNKSIRYVIQKEQLGTGHAVLECKELLKKFDGNILILPGDIPLIKSKLLNTLISSHIKNNYSASILTLKLDNPFGYGRIIRDKHDNLLKIVEEKDAIPIQKKINEVNSGIYIFNSDILIKYLDKIKNQNNQKEYYLTDIFQLLIKANQKINILITEDSNSLKGVNTKKELELLNHIYSRKN